ncbi:MAG: cupin domain-containing protein [Oscillospiraceae bacterium]
MNLFDLPQLVDGEENMAVLYENVAVRIEKIVSKGFSSPKDFWYRQSENEWVFVLQGEGTIDFEDHGITLRAGDSVQILAGVKHRVAGTSVSPDCIWLCVFEKNCP